MSVDSAGRSILTMNGHHLATGGMRETKHLCCLLPHTHSLCPIWDTIFPLSYRAESWLPWALGSRMHTQHPGCSGLLPQAQSHHLLPWFRGLRIGLSSASSFPGTPARGGPITGLLSFHNHLSQQPLILLYPNWFCI